MRKCLIVFWLCCWLQYGAIRCSVTNESASTADIDDREPFAKLIDTVVADKPFARFRQNATSGAAVNATAKKISPNSFDYYNYTTIADNGSPIGEKPSDKSNIVMKIDNTSSDKRKAQEFASPQRSNSTTKNDEKPPSWIIFPLREGLRDFRIKSTPNSKCQAHSDLYRIHLANQSLWALQSKFSRRHFIDR